METIREVLQEEVSFVKILRWEDQGVLLTQVKTTHNR
jgi:hypothetical protein